ncbi:homoserine dehydrogenase [Bacillus sp. LL01]|uniref:homoserine dehydrogenase n=1 Tax=Bacillus sp. LL01 TaxID=1665556 RepID=UPI00064D6758|nr:homoserine dehydrogenase [Bacillus sp. LL01]KMJ58273.1 homoserine dehydrogenase [Bacillus sp. LL01]
MSGINVALLGFGTVGKGVRQSINSHQSRLEQVLGERVRIVGILVKNLEKHKESQEEGVLLTDRFEEILALPDLHVVVDAIVGCEPGNTYLKRAINKGCHIVTANKEMFAHHGEELLALAKKKGVTVGFEATVAGGIPVIQTIRQLLQVNRIQRVEAILNGTSNFILTKMRKDGHSFEDTLKLAQENGYAESDPTNDIEGHDAYYKGLVLSQLIYGQTPDEQTCTRKGITSISADYIDRANELGLRFRHIVTLFKEKGEIHCKVEPALVTSEHPFYQVEGVQNGVSVDTDLVGNIQLNGPGAGMFPTASAILEDIIQINRPVAEVPAYVEFHDERQSPSRWVLFSNEVDIKLPYDTKVLARPTYSTVVVETGNIERVLIDNPLITYFSLKGDYRHTPEKVTI